MIFAPLAGKFAGRLGLRPVIAAGMAMVSAGFIAVALAASVHPTYATLVLAVFVAGVGVSMTLPTVPAAVLGAVDPAEIGAASGTNNMLQRFGAVFGVALATSVFSAYGTLGSPASFTGGYRPAVTAATAFALLGALAGLAVTTTPPTTKRSTSPSPSSATPHEPSVGRVVAPSYLLLRRPPSLCGTDVRVACNC